MLDREWAGREATATRGAVVHFRASLVLSERRTCGIIDADRMSDRYRSRRDDTALGVRLREHAQQRTRFGYRRLHILLLHEGVKINRTKTQRLYTEDRPLGIPSSLNFAVMGGVILLGALSDQQLARRSIASTR